MSYQQFMSFRYFDVPGALSTNLSYMYVNQKSRGVQCTHLEIMNKHVIVTERLNQVIFLIKALGCQNETRKIFSYM